MKKKRTKFLDVAMLTCWCVGVLLLGIFLSMSVVYANCAGDLCDTNDPKCSETSKRNPTPECFQLVSFLMGCFPEDDVVAKLDRASFIHPLSESVLSSTEGARPQGALWSHLCFSTYMHPGKIIS